MANEVGGRTDKNGNRYEMNCIIKAILDVVDEKISSCMFEGLGNDEIATDIIVTNFDGSRKYIQCKHRNGSNDNWTFSGLKSYNLLKRWKTHLDGDQSSIVSLQSPIPFTILTDLSKRAKNNNGDVNVFYDNQIKNSKKTFGDFKKYCSELDLDYENIVDVQKAMNYLKRTEVEDMSDNIIRDYLFMHIKLLFFGESKSNYEKILDLICNEEIMGVDIDKQFLFNFFNKNNIILNNLSNNSSNFDNIENLNSIFKKSIKLINDNYINRDELKNIIININKDKSIMITGKAGYGKSGVIHGLIDYLEKNKYQYLALKLDKYIPEYNSLKWSKNLGFNTYLSAILDKFSLDKKCVLILDQLDALRWTSMHSRNSLDICNSIIEEIKNINIGRKNKISIIFVCRTFDFENDASIRKIVEDDINNWLRIDINILSDKCVKEIIGSDYDRYNAKLKQLLKIPSNLFIFMKIRKDNDLSEVHSTCDLISKWWEQIIKEGSINGFSQNELSSLKEMIVSKMNQIGKISLPEFLLNNYVNSVNFLLSKSFLIKSDKLISFSHQTLLDYFSVEKMIEKYLNGESIESLIGNRNEQLPNKRYQLQMFLERVHELDDQKFLECIDTIINNQNIRIYLKYVAFEVLGTITNMSELIKQYIINNYLKKDFFDIFINIVFMNHQEIIELLIDNGIFDKWINDSTKKQYVINLLKSINYSFNEKEYKFIKRYIMINEQLDRELYSVFPFDVVYDTDELFELRLEIYAKFNELLINSYLNLDELLGINECRGIKYIEFLANHLDLKKRHIKYSDNSSIEYEDKIEIRENELIIDNLLPLIPEIHDKYGLYDWEDHGRLEMNVQRIIISLIKKAAKNIVNSDYNKFWTIFEKYLSKGFSIHNEIILHSILFMPQSASNRIFEYLFSDINNNCFEYTSNNNQSLSMLKKIIEKFINKANKKTITYVIERIIEYKPDDLIEKCKRCIEYKKENFGSANYISFWGDFQYEILNCIPDSLLDEKSIQLKKVLNRKFSVWNYSIYDLNHSKSGSVISPIANKRISLKSWLGILTNKKITNSHKSKYDEEKSIFIDSSLYEFQSSLSLNIQENPNQFIDLFINNSSIIMPDYIYTLYNSLAYSSILNDISIQKLELIFNTFKYTDNYKYAPLICEIIARKEETNWNAETIDMLLNIYSDIISGKIENNSIIDNSKEDRDIAESFELVVINSSIYKLASAVSNILWSNVDYANKFTKMTESMSKSSDEIIKYSSMCILNCLLNYDLDWASKIIIELFSNDCIYGYRSNRNIFNYIYAKKSNLRDKIIKIILYGVTINSKEIRRLFSYLMVDFYLFYDEFKDELLNSKNDIIIKNSIMEMFMVYMKEDEYREKSKDIIIELSKYSDVKINPYKLFDDEELLLNDDKFIIELFQSSDSQEFIEPFIHLLRKRGDNILGYSELLFDIIRIALEQYDENNPTHYYSYDDLNYIVIMLFDYAYDNNNKEMLIKCLDIWDEMFSKQIGLIRKLSKDISEI